MHGFNSLENTNHIPVTSANGDAPLSRYDIDRGIARGHQLRAAHLRMRGQTIACTISALFHHVGRLMPAFRDSLARQPNVKQV